MKIYEIDLNGIKKSEELYQRIIKSMNFPSWCGENFDAIWDMLTWEIDPPASIHIKGTKNLPHEFQEEKDIILEVFDDTREWYKKLKRQVEIIIED